MAFCSVCRYPLNNKGYCYKCNCMRKSRHKARTSTGQRSTGPPNGVLSDAGRAYLEGRGLTAGEIEKYGCFTPPGLPDYVGFPLESPLKGPSIRADGIWTGRSIIEGVPRWRTVKGAGTALWGLSLILPGQPVYVTEGIFDAAHFNRMEDASGVALLRTGPLIEQVKAILDRAPSCVILGPDADVKDEIVDWIRTMFLSSDRRLDVSVVRPPSGAGDFGDLLRETK